LVTAEQKPKEPDGRQNRASICSDYPALSGPNLAKAQISAK
jgi:hypothetical protein